MSAPHVVPDLLPQGFRNRAEALPYSKPPGWMTWIWVVSLGLTGAVTFLTLSGPMDESVLATGEVRPADYDLVFPRVAGTVAEVIAHSGTQVKAGDLLARLDTSDLDKEAETLDADEAKVRSELANAEALKAQVSAAAVPLDQYLLATQVESQRAVVTLRKDLLARLESLQGPNGISLVELTRERLAVKQAEAELVKAERAKALLDGDFGRYRLVEAEAKVTSAKAAVERIAITRSRLERERQRRSITAPNDGQVISRSVRFPGEKAEPGSALFKIARGSVRTIRLYASEDRVGRIRPGMLVRFRSRADPDRLTPMSIGRVEDVALDRDLGKDDGAITTARAGAYAITVTIESAPKDLPWSSAVDGEIVLEKRPFWRLLLMKPGPTGK